MKKRKLYLILFIPIQLIGFYIIELSPNFIEEYYSTGLYKYISSILRILLGFIPLAIGQLIFFAGAILPFVYIFWRAVLLFKKKVRLKEEVKKLVFNGLAIFSIVYFLFNMLWGLNYHRISIADIRHFNKSNYTTTDLIEVSDFLIQETNKFRLQISCNDSLPLTVEISNKVIFEMAKNGYDQISKTNPELEYKYPSIKPMFTPQVYSYLGISGIYSPFTGEALVNASVPTFTLPATVCHEMAHQIGFALEDEANYIAYITCKNNPSPIFKYSGSLLAIRYAMNTLAHIDSCAYRKLINKINFGVMLDIKMHKTFWRQYSGLMNQVSSTFNDLYLKSNHQKQGVESYNLMVNLLIGDYKQNKSR